MTASFYKLHRIAIAVDAFGGFNHRVARAFFLFLPDLQLCPGLLVAHAHNSKGDGRNERTCYVDFVLSLHKPTISSNITCRKLLVSVRHKTQEVLEKFVPNIEKCEYSL